LNCFKLNFLNRERRLYGVILIAFAFLVAELTVGFTNNALVLVADAFHLLSDLIGYIVSLVCIRLGRRGDTAKKREGFTFGLQRAELLGAAFNGVFLLALGISVVLQSVDRFINPSEVNNPVLVAIIGGAGIGSNFLMLALLGSHSHSHGHDGVPMDNISGEGGPGEHVHAAHAHFKRQQPKKRRFDLNVLGVLIHILGDGINSVAVIISAVVYLKTGWIYMDPIASVFGKSEKS
jgi:zinc transporter 1